MGMAFTWYGQQANVEACNFGALALIYPLIERMKVADLVNQHLPADPQAEFDHGRVLSLLMAARLYHPVALVNVAEWASDTGADLLWGLPAEKINDDRLGRSLDAFFTQRHSILAQFAWHVSREFDVPLSELHYDPTHLLFQGAYEEAQARVGVVEGEAIRSDRGLEPAHITKGRATDDAPQGSLMIHAGLCTHVDKWGPLPLFGHTVDGNQNGRRSIAEQLALIRKHLRPPALTMISDRGTFSAGHLARLRAEGYDALCSAPWNEFRPLFDGRRPQLVWKQASYLSLEQQRRRREGDLTQEHYELAVLRHALRDEESQQDIPCRVIFVFSTADQKVVRKQRQKQIDKLLAGLRKIEQSVAAGRRNTDPQSVARRVEKLFGAKQAAGYFSWELVPLSPGAPAAGPRARGCKAPTQRFEFRFDRQAVRRDERYDGYSALVTTVPQNKASADTLFSKFKQQNYSEQINRGFKGPLAVRPVFLHSPRRVEALVFLLIMTLSLYYVLQRLYRQSVPADAPAKERRTTTRTILRVFNRYVLLIHRTRLGREIQTTRLTTRQRELLQRLGFPSPAQILSQRLPRPPT